MQNTSQKFDKYDMFSPLLYYHNLSFRTRSHRPQSPQVLILPTQQNKTKANVKQGHNSLNKDKDKILEKF